MRPPSARIRAQSALEMGTALNGSPLVLVFTLSRRISRHSTASISANLSTSGLSGAHDTSVCSDAAELMKRSCT